MCWEQADSFRPASATFLCIFPDAVTAPLVSSILSRNSCFGSELTYLTLRANVNFSLDLFWFRVPVSPAPPIPSPPPPAAPGPLALYLITQCKPSSLSHTPGFIPHPNQTLVRIPLPSRQDFHLASTARCQNAEHLTKRHRVRSISGTADVSVCEATSFTFAGLYEPPVRFRQ